MKKIKLFSIIALTIFSFVNFSNAQEIEEAIEIATIELYNAEIVSQEGSKINLSFDLFNGERIQSKIKYAVQLISELENDEIILQTGDIDNIFGIESTFQKNSQAILDEKIYSEDIILGENKTISKEIEYIAPSHLNGEFDIWIIAKNENGVLLAMGSPGKIILEGDNQFIKIAPESCYLEVKEESDKKYTIDEGVSINLDENLQVVCELTNNYDKEVSFTPYFNTYYRSTFGELIKENESIQSSLIIKSNEIKSFIFDIPKTNIPQAYDAKLILKENNNNISNSVAFHYVIQGESATIQNLLLDKDYYLAGDVAKVSVYATPSADIFNNSRADVDSINEFNLKLSLYNDNGDLCTNENNLYEILINEQTENLQNFLIDINKDCYNPKVIAIAENSLGDILDKKEYQILTESVEKKSIKENNYVKYGFILILFCIFAIILFFVIKKKINKANLIIILFCVCAGLAFSFFITNEANAGTFVVPGISTSNPYAYEWKLNSCPNWSLSSPGYGGFCYLDRKWPLGPWNISCTGVQNAINGGMSLACRNNTFYVSPGYPYMRATGATYTVNLNKNTYSPGENIRISARAYASYCYNNVYNAYLVVNNNGQWMKIIEKDQTPVVYATKHITAATSPGVHYLTFYGVAFKGHDSTGSIRSYTMQYTVESPAPTISFSASPASVNYNSASTLSWSSSNANSCTASGSWSGSKPINGNESTGNITSSKVYTLTCTGPGGSISKNVNVTVINDPPVVSGSPSVTSGDYCSSPSHYFSWVYSDPDGNTQSRFRFQIDNNSNFSSPTVNRDISGLSNPSPTTNNQTVLVSTSPDTPNSDQLAYNTTYYWRVMVYDNQAASSGWVNGSSFTTTKHKWPMVDFNWAPNEPSKDEDAQFTDQSVVYGGASKSSWLWIFEDGNPANSSVQNPLMKFILDGYKSVTLQVTDSDGYSCFKTKNVNVQERLPGWEEIFPW